MKLFKDILIFIYISALTLILLFIKQLLVWQAPWVTMIKCFQDSVSEVWNWLKSLLFPQFKSFYRCSVYLFKTFANHVDSRHNSFLLIFATLYSPQNLVFNFITTGKSKKSKKNFFLLRSIHFTKIFRYCKMVVTLKQKKLRCTSNSLHIKIFRSSIIIWIVEKKIVHKIVI